LTRDSTPIGCRCCGSFSQASDAPSAPLVALPVPDGPALAGRPAARRRHPDFLIPSRSRRGTNQSPALRRDPACSASAGPAAAVPSSRGGGCVASLGPFLGLSLGCDMLSH